MSWIQTRSGKAVDLLKPEPDTIDFRDIAYALSRLCRFTGHVRRHYSVAEHCVRVSAMLPPTIRLYGLLHDAHEAFIGDISTPVKLSLADMHGEHVRCAIKELEAPIIRAIYEAIGLDEPCKLIRDAIKFADVTMLMTERRDLLGPSPHPWCDFEEVPPLSAAIDPWTAEEAERQFLAQLWAYAPHLQPQVLD